MAIWSGDIAASIDWGLRYIEKTYGTGGTGAYSGKDLSNTEEDDEDA